MPISFNPPHITNSTHTLLGSPQAPTLTPPQNDTHFPESGWHIIHNNTEHYDYPTTDTLENALNALEGTIFCYGKNHPFTGFKHPPQHLKIFHTITPYGIRAYENGILWTAYTNRPTTHQKPYQYQSAYSPILPKTTFTISIQDRTTFPWITKYLTKIKEPEHQKNYVNLMLEEASRHSFSFDEMNRIFAIMDHNNLLPLEEDNKCLEAISLLNGTYKKPLSLSYKSLFSLLRSLMGRVPPLADLYTHNVITQPTHKTYLYDDIEYYHENGRLCVYWLRDEIKKLYTCLLNNDSLNKEDITEILMKKKGIDKETIQSL